MNKPIKIIKAKDIRIEPKIIDAEPRPLTDMQKMRQWIDAARSDIQAQRNNERAVFHQLFS